MFTQILNVYVTMAHYIMKKITVIYNEMNMTMSYYNQYFVVFFEHKDSYFFIDYNLNSNS